MITASSFSLYSGYYAAVPTQSVKRDKRDPPKSRPSAPPPRAATQPSSPSSEQLSSASVAQFLDAAADGPPSPERSRHVTKQMKRVSRLHRQHGHRAASSESSSLASMDAVDRPPWEIALENHFVTRRTSIRSNDSSSTPSRDRAESVHNFSKNLFHRRGKSKRESSSHSSSASSIYSVDGPVDTTGTGTKESLIPTLFSRRKPSRDETNQKRLQISGPFNFQHVAHRQRKQPAYDPQAAYVVDPSADFPDIPGHGPTVMSTAGDGPLAAFHNQHAVSTDSVDEGYEGHHDATTPQQSSFPRQMAPAPGPKRLVKHSRSREHLRKSPPRPPVRPPRSPVETNFASAFPPVPPRISSRQSNYPEPYENAAAAMADRPQTTAGFRRPQPFSPFGSTENLPTGSSGYQTQVAMAEGEPSSPVLGEDMAWPLTSPVQGSYDPILSTLPDVPEEEEHFGLSRRSRLSMVSNNSSLRGSQSVPMLRSLAESQRPMSGASETLGRIERPRVADQETRGLADLDLGMLQESWEDDIDYCYEHEAEADCNYEWERPSLETARDSGSPPTHAFMDKEPDEMEASGLARSCPTLLSPTPYDLPGLSPASQTSAVLGQEAVTPTSNPIVTNNFSLPKGDRKSVRHLELRTLNRASYASSFKESQGFTLSPSLLIPGEYQQQVLIKETEKHANGEYDEYQVPLFQAAFFDDGVHSNMKATPFYQRSSTSTTTTDSTSRSNSTGKRHMSTASSWTTLTRHTASSTSLNKMAGTWTDESEPLPTVNLADKKQAEMDYDASSMATGDVVPELVGFATTTNSRKVQHKSHASESHVVDEPGPGRSPDPPRMRRGRARTTSLSAQTPPPVGQYALFPRAYVKVNNADQI
ncbi:PAK-box/P21-Rho-binding protein [Purpureocillium lavendulum]|uniref:PAK-box/P21-Rho-binding protein n=1 Tax=Purpureocillium lavendulum TaxID=1247861 RepID=A0AB34FS35_9HYPO|nr:PAK-box/P21-Rho-binding protein [Purpureocillium lavendulum]